MVMIIKPIGAQYIKKKWYLWRDRVHDYFFLNDKFYNEMKPKEKEREEWIKKKVYWKKFLHWTYSVPCQCYAFQSYRSISNRMA